MSTPRSRRSSSACGVPLTNISVSPTDQCDSWPDAPQSIDEADDVDDASIVRPPSFLPDFAPHFCM